jgi:hypothetical protein
VNETIQAMGVQDLRFVYGKLVVRIAANRADFNENSLAIVNLALTGRDPSI